MGYICIPPVATCSFYEATIIVQLCSLRLTACTCYSFSMWWTWWRLVNFNSVPKSQHGGRLWDWVASLMFPALYCKNWGKRPGPFYHVNVPRPSHHPVFDHLQYERWKGLWTRLVTQHVHANITRRWWLGTDDNATSWLNSNLLTSNIKFSTKRITQHLQLHRGSSKWGYCHFQRMQLIQVQS